MELASRAGYSTTPLRRNDQDAAAATREDKATLTGGESIAEVPMRIPQMKLINEQYLLLVSVPMTIDFERRRQLASSVAIDARATGAGRSHTHAR